MKAIPETVSPEICTRAEFTDSKFIEIETNGLFEVSMQYPLLGMNNSVNKCLVREEVYEMLLDAAAKLPTGFRFKILDAWRPFNLQKELYEVYSDEIIRYFNLENHSDEHKKDIISSFVSEPVFNKDVPPVHTTGGAVDLTIIDSYGTELNMGTGFDSFSEKAYTSYFEKLDDFEIRDNRRLLYNIMTEAGFTNLPSEWWHYDFGDRFWAYYKETDALYKGVFSEEEINEKR